MLTYFSPAEVVSYVATFGIDIFRSLTAFIVFLDKFSKYGLEDDTVDFIGHALALHKDDSYLDQPARDFVKKVKVKHLVSCFHSFFLTLSLKTEIVIDPSNTACFPFSFHRYHHFFRRHDSQSFHL